MHFFNERVIIMGLITKTVWARLSGATIKHYEDLGYDIPRKKDKQGNMRVPRGTKIMVDVKHLPNKSNIVVKAQCDMCNKKYDIIYQNYTKYNHNGLCYCHDCALKMLSGENHPNWKFDKTEKERENDRNIDGYNDFIKRVLSRDNYTCQCCGKTKLKLQVHHLNGYNWYKEGRIDQKNAITLCENCHNNFHALYGRGNNTKEQYEEWIGYALNELSTYNGKLPTKRKIYCIEDDTIYDSLSDVKDKYDVLESSVRNVCNHKVVKTKYTKANGEVVYYQGKCMTVQNKHFLWYDEYLQMSKEDITGFLKQQKKQSEKSVICLTTNEIFESVVKAQRYYNLTGIYGCCQRKQLYCGKLSDGTKLQWMYYDDYLKTLEDEQEELSKIDVA